MSSRLVESGGKGRYYMSIDFFPDENDYIGTTDELKDRLKACEEMCNSIKAQLEDSDSSIFLNT